MGTHPSAKIVYGLHFDSEDCPHGEEIETWIWRRLNPGCDPPNDDYDMLDESLVGSGMSVHIGGSDSFLSRYVGVELVGTPDYGTTKFELDLLTVSVEQREALIAMGKICGVEPAYHLVTLYF